MRRYNRTWLNGRAALCGLKLHFCTTGNSTVEVFRTTDDVNTARELYKSRSQRELLAFMDGVLAVRDSGSNFRRF